MDQNTLESTVFERLAHPDRREILRIITLTDSTTYTDILSKTGLSTGRLNYHLKYLTGFIEKDQQSQYGLTPLGNVASDLLQSVNQQQINGLTNYLTISEPLTLLPPIRFIIKTLILTFGLFDFFAFLQLHAVIISSRPFIEIAFAILIFGLGIVILGWLYYSFAYVPKFVQRMQEHIYS